MPLVYNIDGDWAMGAGSLSRVRLEIQGRPFHCAHSSLLSYMRDRADFSFSYLMLLIIGLY